MRHTLGILACVAWLAGCVQTVPVRPKVEPTEALRHLCIQELDLRGDVLVRVMKLSGPGQLTQESALVAEGKATVAQSLALYRANYYTLVSQALKRRGVTTSRCHRDEHLNLPRLAVFLVDTEFAGGAYGPSNMTVNIQAQLYVPGHPGAVWVKRVDATDWDVKPGSHSVTVVKAHIAKLITELEGSGWLRGPQRGLELVRQ